MHSKTLKKSASTKGNVLFLILIAVVLFAALSFAVIQSTRGTGKNTSEDKAKLGAAAISQYVSLLREEVQRLIITNGCTIENLDWRNNYWKRLDGDPSVGILHNPTSPKTGCAIFSDYGGPVSPSADFSAYADKNYNATSPNWRVKGGHSTTDWVNRQNEGSAANDIAIIVRGLDHAVCSYLLDPTTKPSNVIESYQYQSDPNIAEFAPWTGNYDVIDEPENLRGDFFANFNSLATGSGCDVGAIIIPK